MAIGRGWWRIALRVAAGFLLALGAANALDADGGEGSLRADPSTSPPAGSGQTAVADCGPDSPQRPPAAHPWFDPARRSLPELRALEQRLEGSSAHYQSWSVEDAERLLTDLAEEASLTVDCSALPCVAAFEGVGIDDLTGWVQQQEGFETALVGGRETEDFTVLVLWDGAPSAAEKIHAQSRSNQILEQLRATEEHR